ncbi:hypothetical protein Tco_0556642 [Tanacetum coccineum]
MVNVIPPDHVDDVPVVELNQHDDVSVILEHVLEDEDDMEPEYVIEVEDTIDSEDETVPASVHETTHALVEKKGKAKDKYYGKLILDLGNEVRSSVEQGTAVMEKLVEKLGNAEEKAECKKLKKELEEARFSNTFLRFVFEERPNEAIDVLVEDEKCRSSELHANAGNDARGSGPVRGQDAAPAIQGKKVKFTAATLEGHALT